MPTSGCLWRLYPSISYMPYFLKKHERSHESSEWIYPFRWVPKVMPVRLAALDLYQQAFSDLECFEKVPDSGDIIGCFLPNIYCSYRWLKKTKKYGTPIASRERYELFMLDYINFCDHDVHRISDISAWWNNGDATIDSPGTCGWLTWPAQVQPAVVWNGIHSENEAGYVFIGYIIYINIYIYIHTYIYIYIIYIYIHIYI